MRKDPVISPADRFAPGLRAATVGLVINALLAVSKGAAGYFGHSYALVADAVESSADVFTSLVVILGLRAARRPADANHPYGHGKFEALASCAVALSLLGAALLVCVHAVRQIRTPHPLPHAYTLAVLVVVVAVKEWLFRRVESVGTESGSRAVVSEAWHHRSDAITSAAAFVGICVALACGPGYESADDFAALLASAVIAGNALLMLRPGLDELLDAAPEPGLRERVREIAHGVPGVLGTHTCLVRKHGLDYYVDLHVRCDPDDTVRESHRTAHRVADAVKAGMGGAVHVLVHVEPADEEEPA